MKKSKIVLFIVIAVLIILCVGILIAVNLINRSYSEIFYGAVTEAYDDHIIVEAYEGEEFLNEMDEIWVNINEEKEYYYVGTRLKITYNGEIEDSKINAKKIELAEVPEFEIQIVKPVRFNEYLGTSRVLSKNEAQDYDVYVSNVGIMITIEDSELELKDAVENEKISIDDIIAKANKDLIEGNISADIDNDLECIAYKYEDYTIIKFNTSDGNQNVYFGNSDFTAQGITGE